MNVRTIHHFEDEPELVKWIPGTLLNLYWRDHPDWITHEGNFVEHDERLTTFQLNPNGTLWTLRYQIYTDQHEFRGNFKGEPSDIVLVDLMNAGATPGFQVYQEAVQALGPAYVYFLTAFPGEVKAQYNTLSDDYVLSKPVDVPDLTRLLIRKLAIG